MRNPERSRRLLQQAQGEYIASMISSWEDQVPNRYLGKNVKEDLEVNKWDGRMGRGAVVNARRYLAEPTNFLLMRGTKGLGKSTLAVTIVREMIEQGMGAGYYRSLPGLLQEFSFPDRDRENPVLRCERVDILLLDDVGASTETISDHQRRCLWQVIDSRWSRGLKTIMTTNMSISSSAEGQGLIDWFGESAWDRIQDDLTVLDFQGDSFRTE